MTLEARDVSFGFNRRQVLRGCDLTVRTGETLGLLGPNGEGKSTLLKLLYGALKPDAGSVTLDGQPISGLKRRDLARRIAVVVQEQRGDISLRVSDAVLMGRIPHRSSLGAPTAPDEELAVAALERVGALHLADRQIDELSGGEQQRVLIARSLCQDPQYLLLDEPTNHLDINFQHQILDLIRGLEMTCVIVLHDPNLAARYCDRIALLGNGTIRQIGTPKEALTPNNVSRLFGVTTEAVEASDGAPQLLFRRVEAL